MFSEDQTVEVDIAHQNFQHPAPQLPIGVNGFVGRDLDLSSSTHSLSSQPWLLHSNFSIRQSDTAGLFSVPDHVFAFAPLLLFSGHAQCRELELFNPTDIQAVVTVNYMLEEGTVIPRTYVLPARRRLSIDTSEIGPRFSTELITDQPIVAERLMFSGSDAGDSIGSPTPAHTWNLAEGFTAFGYQTWVAIANPGTQAANVTVRLMKQSGENVVRSYTWSAKQRITLYLNDLAPNISVSTQVTADQPIVVERTMKFAGGTGMHQAMGVRQ